MTTTFDTASIESTANYVWYMLTHESELSETQVDYLYRAMRDIRIRDEVIRLTVHQRDNRPVWIAIAHHLGEVMGSSTILNSNAGTVMAIMSWLDGDNEWAHEAVTRVLGADPSHSLAFLLRTCIMTGLPQEAWVEGAMALDRATCLHLNDKGEQS